MRDAIDNLWNSGNSWLTKITLLALRTNQINLCQSVTKNQPSPASCSSWFQRFVNQPKARLPKAAN